MKQLTRLLFLTFLLSIFSAGALFATDDLTLENTTISSGQRADWMVLDTITAQNSYFIESGGAGRFVAGDTIELKPGFEARTGCEFEAIIGTDFLYWDGGGEDNNWSTAENWSGDQLPTSSDIVYYGSPSSKNCTLTEGVTVAGMVVTGSYTGTIDFNDNSMAVLGDVLQEGGTVLLGSGTTSITGTLSIDGGTWTEEAGTATIAIIILESGTLNLGSGTTNLTGDLTKTGGTINGNSSTLKFTGTSDQTIALDASVSFYDLEVVAEARIVTFWDTLSANQLKLTGGEVRFRGGKTFTISTLDWNGTSETPILLRPVPDLDGEWELVASNSPEVSYVVVRGSDASGGNEIDATDNCYDSGNNTNWDFGATQNETIPSDISFPSTSLVSPVCVEGKFYWLDDSSSVSADGYGDPVAGVVLSRNLFYADIPLDPSGSATSVSVEFNEDADTEETGSTTWTATDLTDMVAPSDGTVIRKDDSLLFTYTGYGTQFKIDHDGDSNFGSAYDVGEKVATEYDTAGTYTVEVVADYEIQGVFETVATYQVKVVDVAMTLIACQEGYTRQKDVTVTYPSDVVFEASDSDFLEVSVDSVEETTVTLNIASLQRGLATVVARLSDGNGPIIIAQPVVEFTLDVPARSHAATWEVEGGSTGTSALIMRPYVSDIDFSFDMFASDSTFYGGETEFTINTSDAQSSIGESGFQQVWDEETGETIGVFDFTLEVPDEEDQWCFSIEVSQTASAEWDVGTEHGVNGRSCELSVDEIVIGVGGSGNMQVNVEREGASSRVHLISVQDPLPDLTPVSPAGVSPPRVDCISTGSGPIFTVHAGTADPGQYVLYAANEDDPYDKSSSPMVITVVKVDFLKNDNPSIDPATEALNVANYVTTDGLPKKTATAFGTTCNDPDNFRIEVEDASVAGASVDVKIQVNTGAEVTYTLDKKIGTKFRGTFLRLVTDSSDVAASEHGATSDPDKQTILVELGDTVKVKYEPTPGVVCTRELQVGRPKSEDNNGSNQLKHDIRELKLNIVVFKNFAGTAPVRTRAQVESYVETAQERLSQSTIKCVATIDMGGTGDPGITMPTGTGIDYSNGFDAETIFGTSGLTAEEDKLFDHKDSDANSIDVFFVESFSPAAVALVGSRGRSYPKSFAGGNTEYPNNIVMTSTPGVFTLAHEIMHILLNAAHRSGEPDTALFKGGTSATKAVGGTKRIGPYPDAATAGVGNGDTATIRSKTEALP